jgi:hypothetical protein
MSDEAQTATVKYITVCPMCKDEKVFMLPIKGFVRWKGGHVIQNAFPELDAEDRERLISGTCPKCWDKLFGSKEAEI